MKIVVAGATGFLGKALIESLKGEHEVIALVRHGQGVSGAVPVAWDGLHLGNWREQVDGADVVVNYSGSPVTAKMNDENQRLMKATRVQPTYLMGQAIEGAEKPPRLWINASAVGFYGSRGAEIVDETSERGTGFLAELCGLWEGSLDEPKLPNTRRVALRTGIVLGKGGGALKPLLTLTKLFLGGAQGDGHQWMPWIHVDDHTAMVKWLIANEDVSGPVNAVGPAPSLNSVFMQTLRKVVGRPPAPPAPRFMLELVGKIAGPDPEVILASTRAVPKVAQAAGFKWKHPGLEEALRSIVKN